MEDAKYITWDVHREFAERLDAENKRQDARIGELEATVKEIGRLTVSVERMAVSMESMANEQARQGSRLDEIERKPGKRWETVVVEVIKYAVAFILGALIMRFGVAV